MTAKHAHRVDVECTQDCEAYDANGWRCSECKKQVPMMADTEDWAQPLCGGCFDDQAAGDLESQCAAMREALINLRVNMWVPDVSFDDAAVARFNAIVDKALSSSAGRDWEEKIRAEEREEYWIRISDDDSKSRWEAKIRADEKEKIGTRQAMVDSIEARAAYDRGWNEAVEACAKVAESYEPRCEVCPRGVVASIEHLRREVKQ